MEALHVETTEDRFLISIDKRSIDKQYLFYLLDKFRLEYLARKVDFDASIVDLGEEIKSNWWKENKEWFLNRK